MGQDRDDAEFYQDKARGCEQRAGDDAIPHRQRQAYLQAAGMWRELAASARLQQAVSLAAGFAATERR